MMAAMIFSDSVLPDRTGLFFDRQEPEHLIDAVERLERVLPHFDPNDAVRQANNFAPERFDEKILALTRMG